MPLDYGIQRVPEVVEVEEVGEVDFANDVCVRQSAWGGECPRTPRGGVPEVRASDVIDELGFHQLQVLFRYELVRLLAYRGPAAGDSGRKLVSPNVLEENVDQALIV
jgi:hypothetical protein